MPKVSDEHRAARREQIVEAARRCFYRNGFHATTMEEIVKESGLSAGAVYRYFASKDELIETTGIAALAEVMTVLDSVVDSDHPPDPGQAVQSLISAVVGITERDGYDLARLAVHGWAETARNTVLREAVRDGYAHSGAQVAVLLRRWQASGAVSAEIDAETVAPAVLSLLLGFLVQRAVLDTVDPEAYARGVTALLTGTGQPPPT